MVACHDDDMHVGACGVEVHEVVGECLLDRSRRLLDVEDVATDEKGIGMLLEAPGFELTEEMLVFVDAVVVLINDLPEMQIGGMQDFHETGCEWGMTCIDAAKIRIIFEIGKGWGVFFERGSQRWVRRKRISKKGEGRQTLEKWGKT